MPGYRLTHTSLKSCMTTVPLLHKPFSGASLDNCPTCRVVHPVKTVHLWLDDAGTVIVSKGVLEDLRKAGLDVVGLSLSNEVKNPPPLLLNGNTGREEIDHANRRIVRWSPIHN